MNENSCINTTSVWKKKKHWYLSCGFPKLHHFGDFNKSTQKQSGSKKKNLLSCWIFFTYRTHVKIFIILMKKNFQRCAVAHIVAFHMHILEVGSLLLWKFGLGCYTPFCSSLALRAAADGKHDVDSYNSRTE